MNASEFRALLQLSIAGDRAAVEAILLLYMPLINRNSVIAGRFDADCRQYILLYVVSSLKRFTI